MLDPLEVNSRPAEARLTAAVLVALASETMVGKVALGMDGLSRAILLADHLAVAVAIRKVVDNVVVGAVKTVDGSLHPPGLPARGRRFAIGFGLLKVGTGSPACPGMSAASPWRSALGAKPARSHDVFLMHFSHDMMVLLAFFMKSSVALAMNLKTEFARRCAVCGAFSADVA